MLFFLQSLTHVPKTLIFFNQPGGSDTQFKTVLPFPPTLYEIYKSYVKNNKEARKTSDTSAHSALKIQSQQVEDLLDSVKIEKLMFQDFREDTSEQSLTERYRLFALKTLKQIGLPVLQNSYSPERVDRIVVRVIFFPFIGV